MFGQGMASQRPQHAQRGASAHQVPPHVCPIAGKFPAAAVQGHWHVASQLTANAEGEESCSRGPGYEPEEGIQQAKLNAGWRVITKEVIRADTIFAKLRGVWYTW